jgi:pSer/pThr/pTyr-binding forkhead associated (FHA) protein
MIEIHIMNGTDKIQRHDFIGDTISIGRSPDNDIQIKDNEVSRKHLKIHRQGKKYFIKDLNSKNGTLV